MAERNRDQQDRIGKPDPQSEPTPPKVGVAGDLGEVGERKLDESGEREAVKQGIWGNRPKTRDEKPEEPVTRKPATPK